MAYKVYTSYFGNIKFLNKNNVIPVSIARFPPKWYMGLAITDIAPTPDMLRLSVSDYIIRYNGILNRYDPILLCKRLEDLTNDLKSDIALLCFEKPEAFCHRHLLASWLNQHVSAFSEITEYPVPRRFNLKSMLRNL